MPARHQELRPGQVDWLVDLNGVETVHDMSVYAIAILVDPLVLLEVVPPEQIERAVHCDFLAERLPLPGLRAHRMHLVDDRRQAAVRVERAHHRARHLHFPHADDGIGVAPPHQVDCRIVILGAGERRGRLEQHHGVVMLSLFPLDPFHRMQDDGAALGRVARQLGRPREWHLDAVTAGIILDLRTVGGNDQPGAMTALARADRLVADQREASDPAQVLAGHALGAAARGDEEQHFHLPPPSGRSATAAVMRAASCMVRWAPARSCAGQPGSSPRTSRQNAAICP